MSDSKRLRVICNNCAFFFPEKIEKPHSGSCSRYPIKIGSRDNLDFCGEFKSYEAWHGRKMTWTQMFEEFVDV